MCLVSMLVGHYYTFGIGSNNEVWVVRSDNDLPFFLFLTDKRYQVPVNRTIIEVIFWLVQEYRTFIVA